MQKSKLFWSLFFLILASQIYSQVENVPLSHPVYSFLKEMQVKRIIDNINDDNPNLSRFEVREFLTEIDSSSSQLSSTELKLLNRYNIEFYDNEICDANTWQAFGSKQCPENENHLSFFEKPKYLYVYQGKGANLYLELIGHIYGGQSFKPQKNASILYDGGLRIRGTVFDHLGYYFTYDKGIITGSKTFASVLEPKIKTSFKYVEDIEGYGNYEFVNGYLKFYAEPIKDMHLSIQLGREQIKYGYGYGSRLVLSGDNPDMDFLKMNFHYGIISFSSIHASTVGEFNFDRSKNYTKYFAANKVKFSFKNLFDVGIGESIIYSGRGIDLGYLNPFAFYKIVEMSLQDRDNGTLFVDMQTHFLENLELQGTFFLDENILFNLNELDKYINKTAYQVGAFWYEAFGISNLSLIFEYTKIRPYVYSHYTVNNNYSAFGTNLGHRIGPNADEIYSKLSYNINEWIRINIEYEKVRSGENEINSNGLLIKNVGGDMFQGHRDGIDSDEAQFLDGIKINNDIFTFNIRLEPIRDLIFDLTYRHNFENNLSTNVRSENNFAFMKMTVEF
ncbi:MAG: hypothetical protein A2V66_02330 [Ignavibacteria bacterium RBG_13_36_8]|nr:MAG: hypothetical protein A2V66_02330 [Ignavibacteria bacterium RBG_13_36_8]